MNGYRLSIHRPNWFTPEMVEETARRIEAALAEIGIFADQKEVGQANAAFDFCGVEDKDGLLAAFDRARYLALRSMGVDCEWVES